MAELHDRHGLVLDHYGEILDRATLAALLGFVGRLRNGWPGAGESACYRGNCSLSVFRKGQVVAQFLAGQKTSVHDPEGELPEYERSAAALLAVPRTGALPSSSDVVDFGDRHLHLRLGRTDARPPLQP